VPGTVRRLVLLRHAKAEHSGVADELRRLTSLGVRQAGGVGGALRATGLLPERVLVSSALRTQETWQHLAGALAGEPEPEVVLSDALYGAHPGEVVEQVRATDARVRTLLVVGHEPAMSGAAAHLTGSGSPAHVAQVRTGLSTGSYAVLEVVGPWAELEPMGARLVDVVRPAWRD
jgi:phosphohistidine phosphatase